MVDGISPFGPEAEAGAGVGVSAPMIDEDCPQILVGVRLSVAVSELCRGEAGQLAIDWHKSFMQFVILIAVRNRVSAPILQENRYGQKR